MVTPFHPWRATLHRPPIAAPRIERQRAEEPPKKPASICAAAPAKHPAHPENDGQGEGKPCPKTTSVFCPRFAATNELKNFKLNTITASRLRHNFPQTAQIEQTENHQTEPTMITRFYVDNYKCLVNFEYKPRSLELVVGANGSGKTTAFEALECLRDFILNQKKVEEVFPSSALTRWQNRGTMSFELEIDVDGKKYGYSLLINVNGELDWVDSESLRLNGKVISESKNKDEMEENEEGASTFSTFMEVKVYPGGRVREYRVSDIEKSSLGSSIASEFKEAIRGIIFVKMQPSRMSSSMKTSQRRPSKSLANFPAYYLHLLQEKQSLIFDLLPILRENIDGFRSFVLEERGTEARQLRVEFMVEGGKKGQTVRYDFDELSDGQRALIALYTLAFCESNSTLFIDEPENFVSSRELQPWLMLLQERVEDFGGQAVLISHHPEFINVLAPQDAIQFRRNGGGPVMIRPFEVGPYQGLTPAEIVARGWENE